MLNKSLIAIGALLIGVLLVWYGGWTLFADAVAADAQGTRGGLAPLPLIAAVVGVGAIVWALCVLAWQLGKALHRRA